MAAAAIKGWGARCDAAALDNLMPRAVAASIGGWVAMEVFQRQTGPMRNFTYLVADPQQRTAAVIDPSFGAQGLQAIAAAAGWTVSHILNTHHHGDHVRDNARLAAETGAEVVAHEASREGVDVRLHDGDVVIVGSLQLRALHTPGHSPDSTCFLVQGRLFTGDTLFVDECGRCDLDGSDPAAQWGSLHNRLLALDDATVVYPGHDYGAVPVSTIGRERRHNYTLQPRSLDEFIDFVLSP